VIFDTHVFSFMPASDIYARGVDESINFTEGHKWKNKFHWRA